MSEKKNIDEFINAKLEGEEIPFSESDWTAMKKLLDEDKRDKGGGWWKWSLLLVLLVSIVGVAVYFMSGRKVENKILKSEKVEVKKNDENISSVAKTKSEEQKIPETKNILSSVAENKMQIQSFVSVPKVSDAVPKKNIVSNNNIVVSPVKKENDSVKYFQSSVNQNTDFALKSVDKQNSMQKIFVAATVHSTDSTEKKSDNFISIQKTSEQDSSILIVKLDSILADTINSISKIDSSKLKLIDSTIAQVKAIDTTKDKIIVSPMQRRFTVGLLAGANGLQAMNMNGNAVLQNKYGLSPIGGLTFDWKISGFAALGTGVNFYERNKMEARKFSFEKNGMAKDTFATNITSLYFLSAPFNFHYSFRQHHAIFGGAALDYLLSDLAEKRKVTKFVIDNINPPEILHNIRNGFYDFSFSVFAGYEFTPVKNLHAQLSFQYGVTDFVKNDYYFNTSVNHNSFLRLTLKYDLFHLK